MFSLYLYKKKQNCCAFYLSLIPVLANCLKNKNKKGLDLLYQVKSMLEFFQGEEALQSLGLQGRGGCS